MTAFIRSYVRRTPVSFESLTFTNLHCTYAVMGVAADGTPTQAKLYELTMVRGLDLLTEGGWQHKEETT